MLQIPLLQCFISYQNKEQVNFIFKRFWIAQKVLIAALLTLLKIIYECCYKWFLNGDHNLDHFFL